MSPATTPLIRQIHNAPLRLVLAVSGGGSRAIADLLEVSGASATLLEAVVPYSEAAMTAWLGARPEHFCAPRAARAMAVAAFARARSYGAADDLATGIACTASLASDRPKRGAHRAHVALQTAGRTVTWSVELQKGRRGRAEEEQLVGRLVLNVAADAAGIDARLDLPLLQGEQVARRQTLATAAWRDLFLGRTEIVLAAGSQSTRTAVLPGAFNPPHAGHRRMAEIAREVLGAPVALELSVFNVDKPPLDYSEIEERLGRFSAEQAAWLTRAPTFVEKSRLFPEATFVVGADTLRRIADPRYYGGDASACRVALEQIAARGCRFLVFGRDVGGGFLRLRDLDLPAVLRTLCREIPPEQFREDISSTALREGEQG